MDYKELLIKYISLIKGYEGMDYIARIESSYDFLKIDFSENEIQELELLSKIGEERK